MHSLGRSGFGILAVLGLALPLTLLIALAVTVEPVVPAAANHDQPWFQTGSTWTGSIQTTASYEMEGRAFYYWGSSTGSETVRYTQLQGPGAVDVAGDTGLGSLTARTWTANATDMDGDGDDDWLLVQHNPQWLWSTKPPPPHATLYRNDDGTFVSSSPFDLKDRHDCDFADVDLNTRSDLFCAVGLDDDSINELWTQSLSEVFTDASGAFGLTGSPSSGNYRSLTFIKANNDAYPDVYVTRYYGPDGPPLNDETEVDPKPNELWINIDGASFRHAPEFGLDQPVGAPKDTPGCAQAVDFDGDGDQDLLVCGYKQMRLYRNDGTKFVDVTTSAIGGFWKDARVVDLGGTPRRDIVQLKVGSLVVKLWNGSNWKRSYSNSLSAGETLATGDLDGDADEDIYVVRTCASGVNQPDLLYLNGGSGTTFSKTTLEAGVAGCGNDVEPIDYNSDGSEDFIVLNGKQKTAGPLQLLTWR